MKRLLVLAVAATALLANAQTFPGAKPVTLVVPFSAGGPTDRVARDLAEAMRKSMGGRCQFCSGERQRGWRHHWRHQSRQGRT